MIKFKMDVKELAEKMVVLAPCAAAAKSVVKVLILNQKMGENGRVMLFLCFDGKKQIVSYSVANEVQMEEEEAEINVDGKKFSGLAAVLGQREGFASFTVDKVLTVNGGNSSVDFQLLDTAPKLQMEDVMLYKMRVNTTSLRALVRHAGYAYLNEKAYQSLRYVAVRYDKDQSKIIMCSTGGSLFAVDEIKAKFQDTDFPESSFTQLIEGDQLKAVMRMLSDENTSIGVFQSQLFIKNGMNACILVTADVKYPMDMILKQAEESRRPCEIKISVAEMLNAIDIFNIANANDMPLCILKDAGEGKLVMQTKHGEGSTEMNVKKTGSFDGIALNASLLKDIFGNYDKTEEVFLGIGSEREALVVKKRKEYAGVSCLLPVYEKKGK